MMAVLPAREKRFRMEPPSTQRWLLWTKLPPLRGLRSDMMMGFFFGMEEYKGNWNCREEIENKKRKMMLVKNGWEVREEADRVNPRIICVLSLALSLAVVSAPGQIYLNTHPSFTFVSSFSLPDAISHSACPSWVVPRPAKDEGQTPHFERPRSSSRQPGIRPLTS